MKTFITEMVIKNEQDYGFFEGPEISASSWEDAEEQAAKQGAVVVGELL